MTVAAQVTGQVFWHLTSPDDCLLNNVRLGKGWAASISHYVEMAQNDGFTTQYSSFHRDKDKEAFWENTRQDSYSNLPSRMKSLYTFVAKADAEAALSERGWFADTQRIVIAIQPASDAKIHIADASWLDSLPETWAENANHYWQGDQTAKPKPEALLHGRFYCPGWRSPPFGILGRPSEYR